MPLGLVLLTSLADIGGCTRSTTEPEDPFPLYAPPIGWRGDMSSDVVRSILKSDGTVWSWGNGSLGTLGHGYATNSDTPV